MMTYDVHMINMNWTYLMMVIMRHDLIVTAFMIGVINFPSKEAS